MFDVIEDSCGVAVIYHFLYFVIMKELVADGVKQLVMTAVAIKR
eukprot:CAMPEP_0194065500 /NCGR_PEP_ID=MMETSP0009_2-20130614/85504_1 /TAXON_ID=210454 /ORGANISM="Grammatophora oceanica, Strain CCMP 410" /LENGTH=43 /DNA_ID= /DNA_START= /DNA_END= /DNA_ORIENTATION=